MRRIGKVVVLATSSVYVQNLIPFGKSFHENLVIPLIASAARQGSKIGQAHRTKHEKF